MKKSNQNLIRGVILLVITAALLSAAFYNSLTVRKYTLKTDKLQKPLRAALLTDLHSCLYGENQERLIAKIDEQNPDIILMSGDIADDEMSNYGTIALLEGISGKYPCYYVTGNHEIWSNDLKEIKEIFRGYGVGVLEGGIETVTVNGQMINICGVDDPEIGKARFDKQLESVFSLLDKDVYTFFLSHRPERFEQYPSDCLILSGHAHGGQWRIPFIMNGLIAPNQGIFPKYAGGMYEKDGKLMIVSRGLAKESTRIPRVFNPPELVVIDILPMI